MTEHSTPRQIARLRFEDGSVVVTPKDRDVFLTSAERATEACRRVVQHDQRVVHFEEKFVAPLCQWCERHADRIRACYIPSPGSQIQVIVVANSPQFDFGLAEEIAALERALAQNDWRVSVSQLPDADEETLAAFFNTEGALEVFVHTRSAAA